MDHWAAYPLAALWVLGEEGYDVGGLDLVVDGDVPIGAGLSSSAALICATMLACDELLGLELGRPEMARLAQRAESEFVGVPVGAMDPSASLLCRQGHALLLDTRSLAAEQIRCSFETADLALLVIDTGVSHQLRDAAYAERRSACEDAAARLGLSALCDLVPGGLDRALGEIDDELLRRRVRHVVTENARVLEVAALLRAERTKEVGPLLTASHRSLRDDYEVSSPELDLAVDCALESGALGARMTGAGFGGCAIALVEIGDLEVVIEAVERQFAARGLGRPGSFVATPSPGAHPVRQT